MNIKSILTTALLLTSFMNASAQTRYLNVQTDGNHYRSYVVTPKLKVTWDNEKKGSMETSVSSTAANNITASGATLNGQIVNAGETTITECGFYWGTTDNPTIQVVCDGTSTPFSYTLTDLENTTTYYFKAYAVKEGGEVLEGSVRSFNTMTYNEGYSFTYKGVDCVIVNLNINGTVKPYAIAKKNVGATSEITGAGGKPTVTAIKEDSVWSSNKDCYGYYYTWEAANELTPTDLGSDDNSTNDSFNWHVPSKDELDAFCRLLHGSGSWDGSKKALCLTLNDGETSTTLYLPTAGSVLSGYGLQYYSADPRVVLGYYWSKSNIFDNTAFDIQINGNGDFWVYNYPCSYGSNIRAFCEIPSEALPSKDD